MTVKEYCEKNNVTVSELTKMWDKKKFKTFDSFMDSEYVWKPKFKVGDIIIVVDDRDELDPILPFTIIEINNRLEEYVICWLSSDLFINSKFDPMYDCNSNYGVRKGDWLATSDTLKTGTLDPKLLKRLQAAYKNER